MRDYICARRNGSCDPGEMVGTVCVECLEEKQEQLRASTVARMMNSPAYQMELEDIINAN